jgi:hypothetical protein
MDGVSITVGLASWKNRLLYTDINLEYMYWPPVYTKMLFIMSFPASKNELCWRLNNFWLRSMNSVRVVQQSHSIINELVFIMGKHAGDNITTTSQK